MDTIQKAYTLLRTTESNLRGLIETAVIERRYTDLAQLAEIAELLGKAISRSSSDPGHAHSKKLPNISVESPTQAMQISLQGASISKLLAKSPIRQKTDEFPKFEIERDRLVKIGWSKKDRAVYEHRAERDVARAVSLYLAAVPNKDGFKMDNMLPIELADGSEVPSYQAYLVLAWLRHIGLVEKQGKDGYQWVGESFDEPAFNAAWKATPRRA